MNSSKQVTFYITQQPSYEANHSLIARIIAKAYQQGDHVYICLEDQLQLQQLDSVLWSYNDISFLPHQCISHTDETAVAPIVLAHQATQPPTEQKDILLNLTLQPLPDWYQQFQRIIELVNQNIQQKQLSRERYKFYQQQQFDMTTYQL